MEDSKRQYGFQFNMLFTRHVQSSAEKVKRLPPEAGCRLVAQSTPVRQKTKAVADKHNVNQTQTKTMQVKGTLNKIGIEVMLRLKDN